MENLKEMTEWGAGEACSWQRGCKRPKDKATSSLSEERHVVGEGGVELRDASGDTDHRGPFRHYNVG